MVLYVGWGGEKYYMRSSYASEYSDRVSVSERQTRSGGVGCGSAGGSSSVVVSVRFRWGVVLPHFAE